MSRVNETSGHVYKMSRKNKENQWHVAGTRQTQQRSKIGLAQEAISSERPYPQEVVEVGNIN